MLGVFRGMLRGARRIPMTSKRGKKSFYKGKVDIMSAYNSVVLQAIPLAERERVWSRCNYRVVAEECNYRPLWFGTVKTTDLIGHIKFLHW